MTQAIDAAGRLGEAGDFAPPDLMPGEAHVWARIVWDAGDDARYQALLSEDELLRAGRFVFPRDRLRFIRSHAMLRQVLARYAGLAPQDLAFAVEKGGKPVLDGGQSLHFSLSHSGDAAVVAVGLEPVGVDVESLRPMNDAGALVERFFSPQEKRDWQALAPERHGHAFLSAWTRKEAYVKALGTGLATKLDGFSVNFAVPAQLVSPEGWTLRHLDLGPQYLGALAAPRPDLDIRGGLIVF